MTIRYVEGARRPRGLAACLTAACLLTGFIRADLFADCPGTETYNYGDWTVIEACASDEARRSAVGLQDEGKILLVWETRPYPDTILKIDRWDIEAQRFYANGSP